QDEESRQRFAALAPELRALLEGTAGCSPYLAGLIDREADWVEAMLAGPPEDALAEVLGTVATAEPGVTLGGTLRRAKARVALLAALADLGGIWPLEAVTDALTALADAAVHRLVVLLTAEEIRRGKVPGAGPDDAATGAGLVALAMGKMGARELNYSSDIDLICLFDDSRYAAADVGEARAAFIRVTRRMNVLFSDMRA